jgi:phthiodiolone/phenolphthiodiolone dimycocerosates ketoreductase
VRLGIGGHVLPGVETLLAQTTKAEAAGWDSVWWSDHLMGWYPHQAWTSDVTALANAQSSPHAFLDPLVSMATVATHTSRVQLATGVTDLIRRPPALAAQQFLSLHHVSRGRTVLGLGAGEGENLIPYGFPFDRPVARLEEGLRIIRLLWEHDEPVDYDGEFWTLRDAVVGTGAYDGRFPPIWLAAHGPRMLDVTGRLADGWLPIGLPVEGYAAGRDQIRRAAVAAGRDAGAVECGFFAYCLLAEDEVEVERLLAAPLVRAFALILPESAYARHGAEHPLGAGTYGLTDYIPTRLGRDEFLAACDRVPVDVARDLLFAGTPDQLVARARDYAAVGMDHLVLWNVSFFGDVAALKPSYALLEEVRAQLAR